MNNFQIQKIIFVFLTFPNILIPLVEANPLKLERTLTINKSNRFVEQNKLFGSKIYKKNQLLSNLENNRNNILNNGSEINTKKI